MYKCYELKLKISCFPTTYPVYGMTDASGKTGQATEVHERANTKYNKITAVTTMFE